MLHPNCVLFQPQALHTESLSSSNGIYDDVRGEVDCKTVLPLSEIQTLSEQQQLCPTSIADPNKRLVKKRVRKKPLQPVRTKDKQRPFPPRPSNPVLVAQVPNLTSYNSLLVNEAIKLLTSKGLHSGYIEYLRSNTDESIKRSFEKVKKELVNKQSFLGTATSVERYLQAARILYNRLDWKKRRQYEYAARNRVRLQHLSNLTEKRDSLDHDVPLFINDPANFTHEIGADACVMPRSEHIFMDRRSKDDFVRYEAFLSRRIHCPLCPVSAEKLANAVQYQLHMLERHSCAHLYACHFCGMVFPSLEALKIHDNCAEFAATFFQHDDSSDEIQLTMKFATTIMACTDCGSQLPISCSYIGESSITHWDEIINFHALHNSEKLVPLVVYADVQLSHEMRLRIHTMTFVVEDVEVVCPYCGLTDFESVDSLESHFLSHEECNKKCCPVCSKQFSQEAFYREHLLSHLGGKSCYLAVYLSRFCTFITGGVPSCGPNLCVDSSGLIYGGVSSAIFRTKFWKDAVDPWESVTVRKKLNRLKRKLSGPDCRVDQDEIDDEDFINDKIFNKEVDFDFGADLKTNGYFYTAVNSKEETEYSSKLYNSSETECECITGESDFGNGSKLACDMSQRFSTNCRLYARKVLSKKQNVVHAGLWEKVLMCRRCQCLCIGECSMYSHLSRCCPELRRFGNDAAPYDLENGLLVLCVFAGNGIPNSRIKCWECSSTVCSIFGLRVHMAVYHGIFLKTEEVSNNAEILKCIPKFTNSTTRAINTSIGLTPDGCLPVNLEEKKKDALVAKLRLDQGAPPSTSSKTSTVSSLASSKTRNPEAEVETPPVIILNADSSPLEQDCPEPLSVQVIDHVGQISPIEVATLHDVNTTCAQGEITSSRMTPQGFSYKEVDIDEIDGFVHSTHGKYHQANSSSSLFDALFREEESVPINSDPLHDEPTVNEPLLCTSSYEQSLVCEFCCLTLRSYTALKEHWKLHIEIPITCYLCDPPLLLLQTAETFLEHIHAAHTSRLDSYKQHKYIYTKCNFCAFRIRRERVVAHLLSECYMAPCILCGAKLFRRSERTGHWKSHSGVMHRFLCECRRGFATFNAFSEHLCRNKSVNIVTCDTCSVKFSGQGNGRSKALTACVDHYMESHTFNLCCLSCKTEPLETLREHVLLIHVKESTEVVTPKPTLLRCSQIELFNDTFQDYLTPSVSKEKRKDGSDSRQFGNDQEGDFTNQSNSGATLPTLLENSSEDDDVVEIPTLHCDVFDRMETSNLRDGTSPSLLERQRQVLANLVDDLVPPPSVIVIENEAGMVREERVETPNVIPRSSVMDDGEDGILIVDDMSKHSSSSNSVAPVVHTVNEGDDECMMLDVIELPTGVVSHAVAATREKKYKCSMCSQTFLRKSTCRYHEQNSHRNDIISDLCNEVYGVPLDEDSLLYICQQCSVAFEDPQRARRHICEHMKKGLAFPCEMCSSICLTQSNLHEHRQKHESGKLSYRCLNCTPNKIYHDETAIYYHLHVDHGVPIIAFCKNCLVGSANMDRIFGHVMYRECSGGKWSNPHISVPTLLRSLGFAVASDLYFQPKDEVQHRKAETVKCRFAVPTQCSHRSFIRFGEAFTTCSEDPSKCFALVNQNRWHSYLCATNREAPGEMPSVLPETVVKKVRSENLIDMLYSRFKASAMNCQRFADLCIDSASCTSSSCTLAIASTTPSLPLNPRRQDFVSCSTVTSHPSQNPFLQSRTGQHLPQLLHTGLQQVRSGDNISAVGLSQNNLSSSSQYQGVCIFCRCRNVPMVCEPMDRAYKIVSELCMKFRDVHPIAAQTLFSSINSFMRDAVSRRSENCYFWFCRWHFLPQSFDFNGGLVSPLIPSQINAQLLIDNHEKGLVYPDPYSIAIFAPPAVSSSVTSCGFPASLYPMPVTPAVIQFCIVCNKISSSGAMNIDYMIPIPPSTTIREQWAANVCPYLKGSVSQEVLNAFRTQEQARLCLRHFNPRSLVMNASGVIMRVTSALNELPVVNFSRYANLSAEFSQALEKLIDAVVKNQNSSTIAIMLKIVQELVKCNDERCGRSLNTLADVHLHRFHQLPHKFVCSECCSTSCAIRTEDEMIEHFVLKHFNRRSDEVSVPVVYTLYCPLKNCAESHSSIQSFRKHINHAHVGLFSMASDHCATRFYNSDKMSSHNKIHEKHSCDVTCCYLCGIADPWQREITGGVKISHELVHAMKRFEVCKACMLAMGRDHKGVVLIDHFIRQHMVDLPKRFRHCKICRQNVAERKISEHILEQHRLIVFAARFNPHSNGVAVRNGSEFCAYLGIPIEACNTLSLADSAEL